VRVTPGAFGPGQPSHDLYLSPDHAVFVNNVLIPVRLLLNGDTIAQTPRDEVMYFHVELPEHAIILAEGLSVESYLDSGDRANFDGGAMIRLFPDFTERLVARAWETRAAAPLVMTGEAIAAARLMVAENAGVAVTSDFCPTSRTCQPTSPPMRSFHKPRVLETRSRDAYRGRS
jgi:collagen type I/II/III/V/XI/XXIV/XXVII alpha